MRFRALLPLAIFIALGAYPAFAAEVILMVNMNYSSTELQALEEVAKARGQRVEMVPPRKLIPLAEPLFLKRDALKAELIKQFPKTDPAEIKSAVAGMIREGAAWKPNSEISAHVGPARMNELFGMAHKLEQAETASGSVFDQLRRKAAELKAKGDRVDTFVLSSHSDGSNLTGESANRLSANDLYALRQEQAELFESPRHVLLMGCYNLTKPNRQAWRYDLFPTASLLAGFGIQAPSRFDRKSSDFIREVLAKADELDAEMLARRAPLDPKELERAFLALASFTTERHPGVADYCYAVVEGRPETYERDCESQWKDVYEKKEKLRPYWSLVEPAENPPSVGGGELRNFYNTLQAACPAEETASQRSDSRAAERMRVTFRENVIRLIYWSNVQHNFAVYLDSEITAMDRRLATADVAAVMPRLDGTASRVDFVNSYNAITYELRELGRHRLLEDFERLYRPLLYLKGEDTVGKNERLNTEETLARNAIPFQWIEGATVRRKRE